ncbi:MAG: HD domain-containing protein [Zoogloea sp.]|nr:HD domain-containing protein [Zoogloea sp.]
MAMMRTAISRFLEMGRDLGSKRNVKSVLDEVAASAKEISGATWSKVSIADDSLHDAPPPAESEEWESLARRMATAEGPASLVQPISDCPTTHVLGVPLMTPEGENLGTLLLGSYRGNHDGLARGEVAGFLVALAGTAAVALENQRLLKGRKDLLRGVIRMVADAIDAKSPYTGGHCRRVTEVARRLAVAAHETQSGPLKSFQLDASGWEALEIASWLHDCGKLTTPEFVIDKATKLETLYNRIHEIRTRFEVLKRDVEISYWREVAGGGDEPTLRAARDAELHALNEDFAFVAECNLGCENMPESALERLARIAERCWTRTLDDRLGLSAPELARFANQPQRPLPAREALLSDTSDKIVERPNQDLFEPNNPWGFVMDVPTKLYNYGELYNLSIRRGTLSDEERFKIKEHIVQTIVMLSRLPFPRDLAHVPEMAGAHHETMDGRGYPRRLNASEMSVTARIMAIADIFEALTARDRPYRQPNSPEDALVIMQDFCDRKVIDSDLFELLVSRELWRDEWERQARTVTQTNR